MNLEKAIAFILLFGVFIAPQPCAAFDTETHAAITHQAHFESVLANTGPGSIANVLGLDRLATTDPFYIYWNQPRVDYYYNGGASSINGAPTVSFPENFERCQMREFLRPETPILFQIFGDTVEAPGGTALFPIQNWLVRGAIREDDLGYFTSLAAHSIHCPFDLLTSDQGFHPRSLNHFYDPYLNIELQPCSPGETCRKSINWALGNVDSLANPPVEDTNRTNHYSYKDARNAMWWALTREYNNKAGQPYTAARREADAEDRMILWATAFRSLGDVVHLLQDAGQPQHTRNDPHSSFNSNEQQAFEGYTNDRVLGTTGDVNSYVRRFFDTLPSRLTPPPLGNYPPVTFTTPLRFFTTRGDSSDLTARAGLADYSNRGFFSGGTVGSWDPDPTNPGHFLPDPYPSPPKTISPANGYAQTPVPCTGLLNADPRLSAVTCTHYTHAVPDAVDFDYAQNPNAASHDLLPNGFTLPNVPIASESVFRQVFMKFGSNGIVDTDLIALSTDEFDAMGNLAIPRAVAYSAGMLNYFFRGSLQVTAPVDGMYAIVNHGMAHTVDADGYPICSQTVASLVDNTKNLCTAGGIFGFTSVRMNVQDITPQISESGTGTQIDQTTGGTAADGTAAKMVAVARYHRNPCYKPDLTGEPSADSTGAPRTPINCSAPRTAYQEISVSADVLIAPGILDGQNPLEQVFDFSNDPIPINATDLFIQVAYRGPLGAETDGIAVGMVDISEPTYLSLFNSTDYEWKDNTWQIPTGSDSPPVPFTSIQICSGPWQIYDLSNSSWQQLPVTHVLRLAALRDFSNQPYKMSIASAQGNYAVGGQATTWQGRQRQAADERGAGYYYDPMFYGRGLVVGDYVEKPYQLLGTTFPTPSQASAYWDKPALQLTASENVGTVMQPGATPCPFTQP